MRFLSWNRMRVENSNTGNMLQITELERKRSRKCSSILTVSMASREREKIAKFPSRHQHTIASLLSVEPENSPTDVQMFCRLFFLCSVATRHPPMRIAFRSFLLPLFSKGLVCNKTQAHLIYLSEKQQCIQRRGQGQGLASDSPFTHYHHVRIVSLLTYLCTHFSFLQDRCYSNYW